MKTKTVTHTPGPWTCCGNRPGYFPSVHLGPHVEVDGNCRSQVVVNCQSWTPGGIESDECEANARLIAAAPDLLMALKTAEKIIQAARGHFPKSLRDSGRFELELRAAEIGKAIAKAEGREVR